MNSELLRLPGLPFWSLRTTCWVILLLPGLVMSPVFAIQDSAIQEGEIQKEIMTTAKLLDRELFFGNPVYSQAQLSPDGKFISFIKPYKGVRNIWFKQVDEPFDDARPLTADSRPVPGYGWSSDGKYILYVQDKGGDENYQAFAVDPAKAADPESGVPPYRNLTPIDGIQVRFLAAPENRPEVLMLGMNDRDPALHDVYEVEIATGKRTLLRKNEDQIGSWTFDLDGNLRLATKQTPTGGTELLRVEDDGFVKIHESNFEEAFNVIRFHKDGQRFYMSTNVGDDIDLSRLVLMDAATGKSELVESDPENQVDFGSASFDADTDELIATSYVGDRLRTYPRDEKFQQDWDFLKSSLPDGEVGLTSSTDDMNYHLVSVSSDVDPGSLYLYDRAGQKVELVYRSRPELPAEDLAPMKAVRYTARDGMEIPAYLTLPKGVEPRNLPVVIHPHGGPWARDTWGYNPYPQFLANRGYAVLQPNFRSSTGYGKKFLNAGNRQWGTGSMQHDITDGVNWLIEQGIADEDRICIFGGSYGGYATLAGVTFTPDLYSCAIPYVAPSSLITLVESFPAYWRPFLEGTWYRRVGDPEDPADREQMLAISPLTHVDKIKVPMLVVHGANDPRVKQAESDQIVSELYGKGHAVEYICAPDEGHGFRSEENRLALAVAMEGFLARHLGGRVQKEVPSNIQAQLESITVDPKTIGQTPAPDSK